MGSTGFRNPRALQPRALGFLKPVDPLVSVSNLYIVFIAERLTNFPTGHETTDVLSLRGGGGRERLGTRLIT